MKKSPQQLRAAGGKKTAVKAVRPDSLEDFGAIRPTQGRPLPCDETDDGLAALAEEIRTREGGAGLDAVARFRGADLVGILNGIDEDVWNPSSDPEIAAPFDADDSSREGRVQGSPAA